MFQNIILIISFLCFSNFAYCQTESPYHLSKKKEFIFLSTGAITSGLSFYLKDNIEPLTIDKINLLDRNSINSFDRKATQYSSRNAKLGSDVFFYSAAALPAFFLINKRTRNEIPKIGFLYIEANLINVGITLTTKNISLRTRPFVYNSDFDLEEKLEKNARQSFFSGHTSLVATNCFFTAKVFSDYHPNSKWKPFVWSAAIVAPAITGYLRVRAGRHFPTDVMTGYAAGALVGFFTPHLHKKMNRNVELSVLPMGGYFSFRF